MCVLSRGTGGKESSAGAADETGDMRRFRSLIAAVLCFVLVAAGLAPEARAEGELPFELTAPVGVAVARADSTLPACKVTYGKSEALSEWLALGSDAQKEALTKAGYSECRVFAQVDWAIDDPSDWHYNAYWDTDTGRADIDDNHKNETVLGGWAYVKCPVTKAETDSVTILTDIGNPMDEKDARWNDGKAGTYSKGWAGALKTSQYTTVQDQGSRTRYHVEIDFSKHTLFARVRYGVALVKDGKTEYHFSPWSQLAACGKDADNIAFRLGDIFNIAPEIKDLVFVGKQNGHGPFLQYTAVIPEAIRTAVEEIEADGGFALLVTAVRIAGDSEWTELEDTQRAEDGEHLWDISVLETPERTLDSSTSFELRSCYYIYSEGNEFDSVYTDVITYSGTSPLTPTPDSGEATTTPTPKPTPLPSYMLSGTNPDAKKTCKLCGVCPVQPLGVCLFVWIGAMVFLLLLSIIYSRRTKNVGYEGERTRRK